MTSLAALSEARGPTGSSGNGSIHVSLAGVIREFPGVGGTPPLRALGPVDLELRRGEFLSVVGPSGCGKSTLLDLTAGLSRPTAGTVLFEGRPVDGAVPDGVGVVFQEDSAFPWLTVRDNIGFAASQAGTGRAEVEQRVDRALDVTGLGAFASAYPAQLSGGMRQRVCLARTLVAQPRLILLDEPFGALDQQTRLLMGDELLRAWRDTGATVLLVTHSMDEAIMLSDRVAVMSARPGRFIEHITTGWPASRTSAVASDPRFGRLFERVWGLLRAEAAQAMGGAVGHRA